MTARLITIGSLQGQTARWVVELSPHSSPRGIGPLCMALFEASMKWEGLEQGYRFRWRYFETWRDLEVWVTEALEGNPWLERLNTAYKGHFSDPNAEGFQFSSRFGTPMYDYDFIDTGALIRNIARDTWRGAEDYGREESAVAS